MKNLRQIDFSQTPFVAIWEITQACDSACRHCRAEAIDWREPRETYYGRGFGIDQIAFISEGVIMKTLYNE